MTTNRYNATEHQRQAIQAQIDSSKSGPERNRLGQFATPNKLAVKIARYVDSIIGKGMSALRFGDPSIGSGSFFSAALAVYGPKRIESAIGVELDPAFADAARNLWADAGLKVVRGDFTRIVADGTCTPAPNLVLANPPYVRHHHLDREDKERLQRLALEMTGVRVNGLAGLYVYFILLATAWMADGGHAAWLIPSKFMDVNYGESLKRFLTDRVTLIRAHRFDPNDVQFGDALVSSVILVFRKVPPRPDHKPRFSFGGTLEESRIDELLSLDQLRESRKWTVYPRFIQHDQRMLDKVTGPTLANLFRVQRGIATGDNKFFILERADAKRRGLPSKYLRPVLPSPRHLKMSVIDADEDGYPLVERQLCLIDCDLPEQTLAKRHPALWNYLKTAAALGVRDGYLVSKRSPWYKQERREASPFLGTYMGRGVDDTKPFRFIFNQSKAIGTNLYLMLYPRAALAAMLRKHPTRAADVHRLLSRITGHELRAEGRVYGGGLNKIEPRELGRIAATAFVETWPKLASSLWRPVTASLFD